MIIRNTMIPMEKRLKDPNRDIYNSEEETCPVSSDEKNQSK